MRKTLMMALLALGATSSNAHQGNLIGGNRLLNPLTDGNWMPLADLWGTNG